eukprot:scaffold53136_cov42-Phaeocystis_antarctica.AAC.5
MSRTLYGAAILGPSQLKHKGARDETTLLPGAWQRRPPPWRPQKGAPPEAAERPHPCIMHLVIRLGLGLGSGLGSRVG